MVQHAHVAPFPTLHHFLGNNYYVIYSGTQHNRPATEPIITGVTTTTGPQTTTKMVSDTDIPTTENMTHITSDIETSTDGASTTTENGNQSTLTETHTNAMPNATLTTTVVNMDDAPSTVSHSTSESQTDSDTLTVSTGSNTIVTTANEHPPDPASGHPEITTTTSNRRVSSPPLINSGSTSPTVSVRELIAWVLVMIFSTLFIGLLLINLTLLASRRNKSITLCSDESVNNYYHSPPPERTRVESPRHTQPDGTYRMKRNQSYEHIAAKTTDSLGYEIVELNATDESGYEVVED